MVTFFREAITTSCLGALKHLSRMEFIQHFYLAGGTALALQIGHRISTDLDWFSTSLKLNENDRDQIRYELATQVQFEVVMERDGSLITRVQGVDVSFIYQHHPLLESTAEFEGIQLASPTDIGLMKLAAIISRGTRRDFIDLYCLRDIVSLDSLLERAPEKYFDRPSFLAIALRALTYFDDAELQAMPKTLTPIEWKDVRDYCESAAARFARRLRGLE